jgi:hypothetical protein
MFIFSQVLYLTATFPYLMIIAFLARALTLDGAADGLRYLFQPKWELLGEAHVSDGVCGSPTPNIISQNACRYLLSSFFFSL